MTAVFLLNLGGPAQPGGGRALPLRAVPRRAARGRWGRSGKPLAGSSPTGARPPRPRSTSSSAGARRWWSAPRSRRARSRRPWGRTSPPTSAMRCGHPSTDGGASGEALAAGADRGVALPLYPQWANATTRSSLRGAAPRLAAGTGRSSRSAPGTITPAGSTPPRPPCGTRSHEVPAALRDRCSWSSAPTACR